MIQDCAGDPRENYDYDYAPERAKLAALESVKLDPGVECDTSEGITVFRLTPETEQLVAEATSLRNELTEVAAALGLDAADWRDLARGVRELAAEHRALVELGRSGNGPIRPAPSEPEFDVGALVLGGQGADLDPPPAVRHGPGVRVTTDGWRHTARLTPEAERVLREVGFFGAEWIPVPPPSAGDPLMRCVIPEITPADLRPTTVTLEAATINAAEPTGYRSPADAHLPPYLPPDAEIQVVAESVKPEPEILLGQTWRRADWIGDGVIQTGMERIRIVGFQELGALWGVAPAHAEYDGPLVWIGEKEIRSAFQLVPPEVTDGR